MTMPGKPLSQVFGKYRLTVEGAIIRGSGDQYSHGDPVKLRLLLLFQVRFLVFSFQQAPQHIQDEENKDKSTRKRKVLHPTFQPFQGLRGVKTDQGQGACPDHFTGKYCREPALPRDFHQPGGDQGRDHKTDGQFGYEQDAGGVLLNASL